MFRAAVAVCLALGLAGNAAAAPELSPRPDLRSYPAISRALALSPRPEERPAPMRREPGDTADTGPTPARNAHEVSDGPQQICGIPGLTGKTAPVITARVQGCGLRNGVRITAVQGVSLSQASTVDCVTATALNTWVEKAVVPAIGRRGGGVAELRVAAHYTCRPRNRQSGAKLSEHGRGRAIDISGFTLRDGSRIDVLSGWKNRADRRVLKKMHRGACGVFGTVLGPESDRFHRDHFHLDTARYRDGAYCR